MDHLLWLIEHLSVYARAKELQVTALEGQATAEKARADGLQARLDALEKPAEPAGREAKDGVPAGS